jgi:hypothetical protein
MSCRARWSAALSNSRAAFLGEAPRELIGPRGTPTPPTSGPRCPGTRRMLSSLPLNNHATEPRRDFPISRLSLRSASPSNLRAPPLGELATELFGVGPTVASPPSCAIPSEIVAPLIMTHSRSNQVTLPETQTQVKDDRTISDRPRHPAPLWKGTPIATAPTNFSDTIVNIHNPPVPSGSSAR